MRSAFFEAHIGQHDGASGIKCSVDGVSHGDDVDMDEAEMQCVVNCFNFLGVINVFLFTLLILIKKNEILGPAGDQVGTPKEKKRGGNVFKEAKIDIRTLNYAI